MKMRLYVVGNASPDPGEWSIWDEVAIVVAASPRAARLLADRPQGEVAEIPLDRPLLLVSMPEPSMGKDL